MNIKLIKKEQLLFYLPLLFKLEGSNLFSPGLFCSSETCFYLYNDDKPDEIQGSEFIYYIKRILDFSEIKTIYLTKIKNLKKLENNLKIEILTLNSHFDFFIKPRHLKTFLSMLKLVKKANPKVKFYKKKVIYKALFK